MKPFQATLPALMICLMSGSVAWGAAEIGDGQAPIVLAGEIIVGPDKADTKASGARSQRERAGAYQRGTEAVLPAEEEGGFLSPRSGGPTEERAFENRARARAYQQGTDMPGLPASLGEMPVPMTSQDKVRDLRGRARVYTGTGNPQEMDLSHLGADGIPLVTCRSDVDNAAARIGEDSVSGSVFYVMRQGKPVKVRCR